MVDRQGQTCLHLVAGVKGHDGALELAALLLAKGVSVNTQDASKCTALHLAAGSGNELLVRCLMSHRANTLRNSRGQTASKVAKSAGQPQIAAMLEQYETTQAARLLPPAPMGISLMAQSRTSITVSWSLDKGASPNETSPNTAQPTSPRTLAAVPTAAPSDLFMFEVQGTSRCIV
jgi:hypothetical protein